MGRWPACSTRPDRSEGAQIIEQGTLLRRFPTNNRIVPQRNYNRDNNEFVEFSIWHKHISNVRGGSTMENLIADLRYAARTLVKTPAFLLVSVMTLALGIGGNIAIFTLVQAVLLQPLPFPQPERLVRIFDNRAGARDVGMSVPEFEDLRQHSDIFEQISVIFPAPTALTGGERVERVEMLGTSPSYFDMLQAKPALGRAYTQADWVPGVVDGVVISDALWKRQFGGDPNVIGKRIRLDEDGYTIIGVMPPDFRHPGKGLIGDVELWSAAGFVALPYPVPPNRGLRF